MVMCQRVAISEVEETGFDKNVRPDWFGLGASRVCISKLAYIASADVHLVSRCFSIDHE